MKIEIRAGDFVAHPASRMLPDGFLLFAGAVPVRQRYRASDLAAFRVHDGVWARRLDEVCSWAAALSASAVAGLPGAAANTVLPDFFLGQKGLVTWVNAMLGGVAAVSALKSPRQVLFTVRFTDGRRLQACGAEQELTARLPRILSARLSANV